MLVPGTHNATHTYLWGPSLPVPAVEGLDSPPKWDFQTWKNKHQTDCAVTYNYSGDLRQEGKLLESSRPD